MLDFLDWMLSPLIELFVSIYRADHRPEARRFTIGCFLIVAAIFILVGVLFYYFG
ncbi:MAG TPA: hypothetical protein VN844_05275 [Pyrinomonadaceae bacterium]|nr:hypothetical protein [Pyrinomonadaceae bacterium]